MLKNICFFLRGGCVALWLAWAGAAAGPVLASERASEQASAPAAPLKLRVVGGLAAVSQYVNHEEPFWTRTWPA